MANVRIKDLTTTAATTASDDFFGVDGATNGTRKLNAYSPTFGGNLTVSGGTGTIDATSGTASATLNLVGRSSGTAKTASVLANSAGSLVLGAEGAGSSLTIAANTGNTTVAYNLTVSGTGTSSVAGSLGVGTTSPGTLLDAVGTSSTGLVRVTDYSNGDAGQFIARGSRGTPSAPTAQSASDSTGLLRMYGYDGSSFIENARIYAQTAGTIATNRVGGVLSFWTHPDSTSAIAEAMRITQGQNLLIGTTTDGGQKLQVAGTGYISGNTRVGDATGTKLLEIAGSNSVSGAGAALALVAGSTYFGYIGRASYVTSGSRNTNDVGYLADTGLGHYFYTNGGTLALTLDSSQRTILSGALRLANSYVATPQISTGYVTIQDSTGTTYKVLVAP